ncbi:hypothetical protein H2508_09260 [Parahaliea sp. F7430]|uniref:TIGR02001 family outer membrane protein n=1 Tax=Sediminihaliea albiluteola TaxID=2758564 RepID=A0A7W2TWK8_9GAMM|nr:TorF family putative porin [Sediminihaliea albiluteola]MBA6413296.1 hypothetical protein [Sediminihaliea albiluteola]
MLNKQKLLPLTLAAALLNGIPLAMAEPQVSANISLTSDYRFRGISQSNKSSALQGGFDVVFEPGFYVGIWGSTVDFDSNEGFDGSLELDYYAGWSMETASAVGLDLGYIYYDYPGDEGAEGDYQELYAKVSYKDVTLGINYSDDYYASSDELLYYYADYSLSLNEIWSLDIHLGYSELQRGGGFLATTEDSYMDYSLAVTASLMEVDWTLAYVGSDLEQEEVFDTDWGDDSLVFSVSKSF